MLVLLALSALAIDGHSCDDVATGFYLVGDDDSLTFIDPSDYATATKKGDNLLYCPPDNLAGNYLGVASDCDGSTTPYCSQAQRTHSAFDAILPMQRVVSKYVIDRKAEAHQTFKDSHGYVTVPGGLQLVNGKLYVLNHHGSVSALLVGGPVLFTKLATSRFGGEFRNWQSTRLLTGSTRGVSCGIQDTLANFNYLLLGVNKSKSEIKNPDSCNSGNTPYITLRGVKVNYDSTTTPCHCEVSLEEQINVLEQHLELLH